MIAVRIEGRLGNQLFQYAFIYAAAKRLNTSFYVDKGIEKYLLSSYFKVENDFLYPLDKYIFSISGFKNIFNHHLRRLVYSIVNWVILQKEPLIITSEETVFEALKRVEDKKLYHGFFQSEEYFKSYKEDIRNLFSVKKNHQDAFQSVYNKLGIVGKTVVVHVRRGDYVGLGIALNTAYYHKAIAEVGSESNHYIFISDDTQFVESEFAYVKNKYVSTNSEIIDFQFLLHANTCILSASSFSWWGAYLNTNNPKVIVPQYWLGRDKQVEYPNGTIQNNWLKL